jgi:hypothetical protein
MKWRLPEYIQHVTQYVTAFAAEIVYLLSLSVTLVCTFWYRTKVNVIATISNRVRVIPGLFSFSWCWSVHLFIGLPAFLMPAGLYSCSNRECVYRQLLTQVSTCTYNQQHFNLSCTYLLPLLPLHLFHGLVAVRYHLPTSDRPPRSVLVTHPQHTPLTASPGHAAHFVRCTIPNTVWHFKYPTQSYVHPGSGSSSPGRPFSRFPENVCVYWSTPCPISPFMLSIN